MKIRRLEYLLASTATVATIATIVFMPTAVEAGGGSAGPLIGHHSFVKPFVGDYWQEGIPHWEVGGDAVVTEKFVRLTPKLNSKFGWIWNDQPNDNMNFEARLSFISRNRRVAQADGLALWLITNPNRNSFIEPGPLAGMHSNFQGIGIVLDTYDNDNRRDNPLVSLVENMEGISRQWDVERDLTTDSRARCTFDFRTAGEVPSEMIVTYLDRKLVVRMRNPERSLDVTCFEVDGIKLSPNQEYYFGLTATTGQIADNHDVVSFEVRALGESIGDPNIPLDHHDHDRERSDKSFHGEQKRTRPRHSEAPSPDEEALVAPVVNIPDIGLPAQPALHAGQRVIPDESTIQRPQIPRPNQQQDYQQAPQQQQVPHQQLQHIPQQQVPQQHVPQSQQYNQQQQVPQQQVPQQQIPTHVPQQQVPTHVPQQQYNQQQQVPQQQHVPQNHQQYNNQQQAPVQQQHNQVLQQDYQQAPPQQQYNQQQQAPQNHQVPQNIPQDHHQQQHVPQNQQQYQQQHVPQSQQYNQQVPQQQVPQQQIPTHVPQQQVPQQQYNQQQQVPVQQQYNQNHQYQQQQHVPQNQQQQQYNQQQQHIPQNQQQYNQQQVPQQVPQNQQYQQHQQQQHYNNGQQQQYNQQHNQNQQQQYQQQ